MTTNKTIDGFYVELDKAKNKDRNLPIDPEIVTCVHFLNVTITNVNGQLRTSIYHKPYVLPYPSDHPRHIYRNIPYVALLQAARVFSHVNVFSLGCIRIDICLLLNTYLPTCITQQFNRFFILIMQCLYLMA